MWVTVDFDFFPNVSLLNSEVANDVECVSTHVSSPNLPSMLSTIKLGGKLSLQQRGCMQSLLMKHIEVFQSADGRIGCTADVDHEIDTGDAEPIRSPPYRVSAFERKIIAEKVSEMVADGIVKPSRSPWASPVVLVKKKSGEHRFCVDYRRVNAVTKRDVDPLPRIDDVLDRLAGAKYFSSLDLASGYWQVPVRESDRDKTAFITPDGLWQFKRLPFGLCSAPATFQRLMNTVLGRLKWHMCLVYLDDILVFGKTFEEHQQRLDQVLISLMKSNLILNVSKCSFAVSQVSYLGHVINENGVTPEEGKVVSLKDFKTPDLRSLRGFIGLASFYSKFIPGFTSLAYPLTVLLKKNAKWSWGQVQ